MNLSKEIQKLHSFAIPTRIMEIGCGLSLSNLLFSENKASNTIYDVKSPYNREAQLKISKEIKNNRAVSVENTLIFLQSLYKSKKTLFYYVANFQIGGNPEKNQTTHGYIGICTPDGEISIFHITIPGEDNRVNLINKIGEIGFKLLFNAQSYYKQPTNYESFDVPNVDIVYKMGNGIKLADNNIITKPPLQNIDKTLELFLEKEYNKYNEDDDEFLCYHNGEFFRFEDFFRDKKKVLIYKGSFNPITTAHIEILDKAVEQEQPDFFCLMLSTSIYGKSALGINEIKERMSYADVLGLPLLIGKSYRYLDAIKQFRERQFGFKNTELQFLMGQDTIRRIFESEDVFFYNDPNLTNVTYLHVNRAGLHGDLIRNLDSYEYSKHDDSLNIKHIDDFEDNGIISSTKVRELLSSNKLDELKLLVPEKVLDIIIKK